MKRIVAVLAFVLVAGESYAFYNPEQGRWLSRDPLGDEVVLLSHLRNVARREREYFKNRSRDPAYAFVDNDPLNTIDPHGLFKWKDLIPPGIGWGDLLPKVSVPCIVLIGGLDVVTTKLKGGGTSYNLQHCITSCKIGKVCKSGVLNHAAGLFKELFDEYKNKLPFNPFNPDDEWDSSDIEANKEGQGCAKSGKGCECCCRDLGYTN